MSAHTWLAVAGVIVGVCAVVWVTGLMLRRASDRYPPFPLDDGPATQQEWLAAGDPTDPNDAERLFLAHLNLYDTGGGEPPSPAVGQELRGDAPTSGGG